jgi:hypothetical protein
MGIKDLSIRPLKTEDVETLDRFRRGYDAAYLELPHGMAGPGMETAVVEKAGKIIGSLTGIKAVVCDPFIHDPEADGVDVFAGVLMLERVLAYNAQIGGAIDSYIAVPKQLKAYIEMVKRAGYSETCENCVIMRRPLIPDVVPLIEHERTDVSK